jgi:predicted nuclease of restriction endonuclease-like (RecB) superfamily
MSQTRKKTATRTKKAQLAPAAAPEAAQSSGELFARVAAILEQARANVVRAVNTNMVLAYWLIGREIVQEIQGGKKRAEYGRMVLETLSKQLTGKYGNGFSTQTLWSFRQFYQSFPDRDPRILYPAGREFEASGKPEIWHPVGDQLLAPAKCYPAGSKSRAGFSPQLSWSHYRALMRVEKPAARDFYEGEAIAGGWDKRTLERQIHSSYYERLLKSQRPKKLLAEGRSLVVEHEPAIETLKSPYVLEFLALPESASFHETELEAAILSRLQAFLLELGTGFAFVARQKRLRFGDDDRYVDLVFYHCRLKFYLLIDLKITELSHGDVGQMDGYVRMFDDLEAGADDNPTIGLILCAERNETVAKYSVLKDRKQIFASKYMLFLPTEEELRRELQRERRLIDEAREMDSEEEAT